MSKPLTREDVRRLLAEGREVREDLEQRIKRMRAPEQSADYVRGYEDGLAAAQRWTRASGSLPVLPTCGDCGWHVVGRFAYCCHDEAPKKDPQVLASDAPPSWCPLREASR